MKSFSIKTRKAHDLCKKSNLKIQTPDEIYFMGIGGTAMASLAVYLKKQGFKVSGSDQNIYPPMSLALEKSGISVSDYSANNIKNSIKLILVGNVISSHHLEMKKARKLKIPLISFPEFLEQTMLKQTKNVVIAGTHGKSTCTALMSYIGEKTGHNPGFFMGALPCNFSDSFRVTKSPYFIVEGDEYDSSFFVKQPKFLYYKPTFALLTGIEFDHGDIYKSIDEITNRFCEFIKKIPKEGWLVACAQNKQLAKVMACSKAPVLTYGIDKGDWTIKNRRVRNKFQVFDICHKKEIYHCRLPLLGKHNALNALGVFVLAKSLNWPVDKILQALKSFKGIKRRLEFKFYFKGAEIYEDFAHHPTEVQAGLSALKEKYPRKRLIALFEPRSFTSRLNVFQKDYVRAFEKADLIFIAKAYDSSKISKDKRFSVQQLAEDLQKKGQKALSCDNYGDLEHNFIRKIRAGDVAVFMSSGNFGGFLQKIQENSRLLVK